MKLKKKVGIKFKKKVGIKLKKKLFFSKTFSEKNEKAEKIENEIFFVEY